MNSFNQYYWYGDMWSQQLPYQQQQQSSYPLQYYQVVPVYYVAATSSPGAAVTNTPIRYHHQHQQQHQVSIHQQQHKQQTNDAQVAGGKSAGDEVVAEPAAAAPTQVAPNMIPAMIMCNGSLTTIATSPVPVGISLHAPTPIPVSSPSSTAASVVNDDEQSNMNAIYTPRPHPLLHPPPPPLPPHHQHHHLLLPHPYSQHPHLHQHHLQHLPQACFHATSVLAPPPVSPMHQPTPTLAPTTTTIPMNKPVIAFSPLNIGYNLTSMLPIDAQPTKIRQAYGMDKVWQDEFEQLFSQFFSNVCWNLLEVESNPNIRDDSSSIIDYRGRYLIRAASCVCEDNDDDGDEEDDDDEDENEENRLEEENSANGSTRASLTSEEDGYQEEEEEEEEEEDTNLVDEKHESTKNNSNKIPELDLQTLKTKTFRGASTLSDGKKADQNTTKVNVEGAVTSELVKNEKVEEGKLKLREHTTDIENADCTGEDECVESDIDSGAQVTCKTRCDASETSCIDDLTLGENCFGSQTTSGLASSISSSPTESSSSSVALSTCSSLINNENLSVTVEESFTGEEKGDTGVAKKIPTRFRMFIDSAKVRFCCDNCGHGWTSMKGRVVFWYELFELVYPKTSKDGKQTTHLQNQHISSQDEELMNHCHEGKVLEHEVNVYPHYHEQENSYLIGYCAYKLFGQQCQVCRVDNRFERPMWYPEEVTKVLNNLYTKIGQVYFGFKMPAIIKQRRAGKPKTSHNNSLCQACHDGVCTDRK